MKFDTVGEAAPGVEIRIAENGEVLVRGPMLLKEYYKRPDATAESIDSGGYFRTGDAGVIDGAGHLQDHRSREGRRQDGERRDVRAELHREQAQVLPAHQGGGRLRRRSRHGLRVRQHRHGLGRQLGGAPRACRTRATPISPASPRCTSSSAKCVEQVNAELAAEGDLAASQIHRFLILHKELDPDDDELTAHAQGAPRLRRREVPGADRRPVLRAQTVQHVETAVKFEDGRAGMVAADLAIAEAKTFPAQRGGA